MKCTAIVLLITAGALLAMAVTGCSLHRNLTDGSTAVGAEVTAADVFAAWDRYEAARVRAEK